MTRKRKVFHRRGSNSRVTEDMRVIGPAHEGIGHAGEDVPVIEADIELPKYRIGDEEQVQERCGRQQEIRRRDTSARRPRREAAPGGVTAGRCSRTAESTNYPRGQYSPPALQSEGPERPSRYRPKSAAVRSTSRVSIWLYPGLLARIRAVSNCLAKTA